MEKKVKELNVILFSSAVLILLAIIGLMILRDYLKKYESKSEDIQLLVLATLLISLVIGFVALTMLILSQDVPLASTWSFGCALISVVIAILSGVWVDICIKAVREHKTSRVSKK
jgi:uncharacterized membrane protein